MMEIKKMSAARGWIWIKQGYQLIMRNPLMSISLAMICFFILFVAINIPKIGPLLFFLLMPVVICSYMRVCRALEEGEKVELKYVLEGFRVRSARLIALGGIAIMGLLITSIAMFLIGGAELETLAESIKATNDLQVMFEAMSLAGPGVAFSLLVGLTLVLVLAIALQYSPMLVFFRGLSPLDALRASLTGTIRNIIPYTVYSLIMQVFALVLSEIPFGIGIIVFLPLSLTSLYVSYRNIFPYEAEVEMIST